nr:uncharacterized protein LOC6625587 isoform X1 [Drosophila virilis]
MFVKCCLPIALGLLLLQLATGSRGSSLEQPEQPRHELPLSQSLSECAAKQGECDESEGPVCGTDDQTYPTRCHLLRVQCSGHQVSLKHRGNCKGCLVALKYARERARNPKIFFPRCRSDGNYAAVQCLVGSGCWCSDSSGKPIRNTTTRRSRPKCGAYRRNNRRRSPQRQLSMDADLANSSEVAGSGHRPCSKADRLAFNNHLIKVFRSEHVRSGQIETAAVSDAAVLDWKFAQLDANANQLLDRQEVRELKKLVKRAVKPRRCGRAFGKYCDVNRDDSLSRLEWSNCLSKDTSHRKTAVNIVNSGSTISSITSPTIPRRTHYPNLHNIDHTNPHHDHTNTNIIGTSSTGSGTNSRIHELGNGSEEHEDDYIGEDEDVSMTHPRTSPLSPSTFNSLGMLPKGSIESILMGLSFTVLNAKTAEATNNESEGDANCWTDREVAREEQRHGGNRSFFVPECMADGRYKRVQCYSSICWCVNEETGKNIPGTFGQKRPQCDEVAAVRPMKGCTEPRKTQFLKELKEFLNTQILPSSNTGNSTMWKSEDERIATLSFVFLDKNKNKSWERKEWKVFRDLVTSASNLSKCGKKMPRYCDANGDKKISLSEWLNCLQSQRTESTTTAKPARSNETATSRLLGSNPLEHYLKD